MSVMIRKRCVRAGGNAVLVGIVLCASITTGAAPLEEYIEEITSPEEGGSITVSETLQLRFTGQPNTTYCFNFVYLSVTPATTTKYDVTTDGSGDGALNLLWAQSGGSEWAVGDYVIQMRAGAGNDSGSTLDTRSFFVTEEE